MAWSKQAICQKASYTRLLQPCNSWTLNFILDTLCPCPLDTKELQASRLMEIHIYSDTLIAGSFHQGFGLPKYMFKGHRDRIWHAPDLDVMRQDLGVIIVDKDSKETNADTVRIVGITDTSKTRPGYLRIQ